MVDRQHGVRLATAKGSLELDDRIATLAGETLNNGVQQKPHPFGDEGALEEELRVLVLSGCRAGMHTGQVCRELGLLEGALENVLVGDCDFTPRSEAHGDSLMRTSPVAFHVRFPPQLSRCLSRR